MSKGRLPTFVVIGAMKAGTTALWQRLRRHPEVFMPDVKEIHYFSNPDRLERGLDWYRAHFAGAGDEPAVGEASTNYTKHPRRSGTAARMAEVIPHVRLVYLVRDPVERIRSHYLHLVAGHGERRSLAEVVDADPELLDISRYRMQIDQYLDWFDRSQLLVVTSESLGDRSSDTVGRVCEFLEIGPAPAVPVARSQQHRSADKRVDTDASRRVRSIRGFEALRAITPRPLRRLGARVVKRPASVEGDSTVSDELRARIEDELRDDVAGLRGLVTEPFDGWGIA